MTERDETRHPAETAGDRMHEMRRTLVRAVEGLVNVGRLWAVHGIEIGRSSLRASAETLRVTADVLGEVSKRIAERAKPSEQGDEPSEPRAA
jgi:hypothetical protein